MKRIYEYKCRECDEIFTVLTDEDYRTVGHQHSCGGWGDYIISRPYLAASIDSDKWVKNRQSHMKKEQKNMERHGTYK